MNHIKLLFLLIILANAEPILAVTMVSPLGMAKHIPTLTTEFGKTGVVDKIDPRGQWIRISNKKYRLNGSGSLKLEDLYSGMQVHYNVEKSHDEKYGRVTRMWVE